MAKIKDIVSRIKNNLRLLDVNNFVTDRQVYFTFSKHMDNVLFQMSKKFNVYNHSSLYYYLPYLALEDHTLLEDCHLDDEILECCNGKMRRTKKPLPQIRVINGRPLIRGVYNITRSIKMDVITFPQYIAIAKRKKRAGLYYDPQYAIYESNHLYLPESALRAIAIDASFTDNVAALQCDKDKECLSMLEAPIPLPDEYVSLAEQQAIQELMLLYNIPINPAFISDNMMRQARK